MAGGKGEEKVVALVEQDCLADTISSPGFVTRLRDALQAVVHVFAVSVASGQISAHLLLEISDVG